MDEKNKSELKKALRRLPHYEPPENIWDGIESDLFSDQLSKAVKILPEYDPPSLVWEKVSKTIAEDSLHKNTGKIISLNWKKGLLAASIAGFILMVSIFTIFKPNEKVSLSYNTEVLNPALERLLENWDEDEEAFTQVLEELESHSFVAQNQEFILLKGELNELDEAKTEIRTALNEFDENIHLYKQLTRIEQARSDVLKKMVVLNI